MKRTKRQAFMKIAMLGKTHSIPEVSGFFVKESPVFPALSMTLPEPVIFFNLT